MQGSNSKAVSRERSRPAPACHGMSAPSRPPGPRAPADLPLRAQSVCLAERPRSRSARPVRSAGHRSRYPDKQFINRPPSKTKPRPRPKKVLVKQQNRKVIEKIPCAVSVQTLSIPMKYADPKAKHSTSKPPQYERPDYRTKSSNPLKQVSDNKRLCSTVGGGKETENKLLLQICEAEQVSDFERILNSNAILCRREHGHVWRPSAASLGPRPRSAYSLQAVSDAYHQLFRQHEESLQPLIQSYRQAAAAADAESSSPPVSILQDNWFENLQNLSEFYEEDQELQQEIESITDRIVTQEIKAVETSFRAKNKNFNVNLADLIGLRVNGEGFSPLSVQDGPSPDIDKEAELEAEDKEWLGASMSANSEFDPASQDTNDFVECLSKNLNSVQIDSNAKVPTITFSNCCDGCARSEQPNNTEVVIHLAVPSIESADEARPPM